MMVNYKFLGLAVIIVMGMGIFMLACNTPEFEIESKVELKGAGQVSGDGTYKKGQGIAVKAKPNEGYEFVKWMENGRKLSTSWNPLIVRDVRTLIAKFEFKE
ncbi:InlB B-repeat-containing protein [Natranaerobius trueperi]|uniref:Bacterial repeat domain-containing protein n=1 Tax=Natranaerobius trueperi TaxID=759412 RepID=A0A226BXQ2_9FIRM|nr:hypothetical protein [Natranaerobius trueperi]OWZ82887.1 hypothetical protein CDO51_11675 [Natranaerobius trueperi]